MRTFRFHRGRSGQAVRARVPRPRAHGGSPPPRRAGPPRRGRPRRAGRGEVERGSAVVEFLGATLVLVLPLVYLVVTLGRVQAATFAAEAAANGAARVFVTSPDERTGERLAAAAAVTAFDDQHVAGADASALRLVCAAEGCGTPGSAVTAHVHLDVPLPGAPRFLRAHVPLSIAVEADASGEFDRYADLSGWS